MSDVRPTRFFGFSSLRKLRKFSPGDLAVKWPGVGREQLVLSQEQRDEIAKLNLRGLFFGGGHDQDRNTNPPNLDDPAQKRFQQTIDEANKRAVENREKTLSVLAPEQKAKWSELTDDAFKFTSRQRSAARGNGTRSSEPAKPSAEKKNQ